MIWKMKTKRPGYRDFEPSLVIYVLLMSMLLIVSMTLVIQNPSFRDALYSVHPTVHILVGAIIDNQLSTSVLFGALLALPAVTISMWWNDVKNRGLMTKLDNIESMLCKTVKSDVSCEESTQINRLDIIEKKLDKLSSIYSEKRKWRCP